jgi:lauroyl/myristoyl acyltransferase
VRDATAAIARGLEGFIRLRPEQWYIFRSMWSE